MSKKVKKLLEEGTIRKFMKYANIEPLAETFLDTVEEDEGLDEEDYLEDMDMGEEPAMDMDEKPAMGAEPEPEVDEEMVQRIVSAVADAIEQETGVAVDVDGGDEPEMDMGEEPAMAPEPEMDDDPVEMAEAPEEEVEEGMGMSKMKYNREDDDEDLDEAKKDDDDDDDEEMTEEFDYDSVVAEVAKRVALRLVKESKKK